MGYGGCRSDHIAIRTSSYAGIGERNSTIRIHDLSYLLKNINYDDPLLIVDDVFDTGRTIEALINELQTKARKNCPKDIRVAVPRKTKPKAAADNDKMIQVRMKRVGIRKGRKKQSPQNNKEKGKAGQIRKPQ